MDFLPEPLNRPQVLECASPLAPFKHAGIESGRGLAHSKSLRDSWSSACAEQKGAPRQPLVLTLIRDPLTMGNREFEIYPGSGRYRVNWTFT